MEQELRQKLNQLGDSTNDEKGELIRRLEDLQGEVRHLQSTKNEKDERLRMQVARNEQLLDQLERINMELTQAREEQEMTLQAKTDKEREAERDKELLSRVERSLERIVGLHGQKKGLLKAVKELSEAHGIQVP